MKNSILIIASLFLINLVSCTQEIITQPPQNNSSGKIMLKIDQANAPESVVFVTATLSRENHDTLSATMNLLSDTTAESTFNEVVVGTWFLKVDAKDSSEQILYTGSTEVTVLSGILTQVSLVLNPTGVGTGGIYIYVTWGTPVSYSWIDYTQNPVLTKSNVWWESIGVSQGKILVEDGQYKMWYMSLSGGPTAHISYATSTDGVSWTKSNQNPVLSPTLGSWDDESVNQGPVIKVDGTYKLYYFGCSSSSGNWHIGMATSLDGINWNKLPNPVLYAGSGWESQLVVSSVVKVGDTYYMYYSGINSGYCKIGLATSLDGVNWTRYSNNPILVKSEGWEGTGIYYPSVIYENNMFKMVYSNRNGSLTSAFGMATSNDGINWIKSTSNPFFTRQSTANHWADDAIAYPNFIKLNSQYRVYYSGLGANSSQYRIGFMSKQSN